MKEETNINLNNLHYAKWTYFTQLLSRKIRRMNKIKKIFKEKL